MRRKHFLTLAILLSTALLINFKPAPEEQALEIKEAEVVEVTHTSTPSIAYIADEEVEQQELPYEEVMLEVSYYCACAKCCDVETGITASGAKVKEGRTIAMPKNIPFGTEVYIAELNHTFVVEDRGGYIQQLPDGTMRVDVYVSNHSKALDLGRHLSSGIIYN